VRLPWRRGSTIEVRSRGRDNNFNLIRLLAAALVLVSHSWPLTATLGEPLEGVAGFSLGHFGVDIFFVVSGFLVTGSLLARPTLMDFARSRALRIFPALVASAWATAFVVGPLVSALPLGRYLAHPDAWRYALQNSVTWPLGVCWWLPGVFLQNPGGPAVNGALWSLPWELTMYVLLFMLGLWLLRERGPRSTTELKFVVCVVAIATALGHGLNEAFGLTHRFELVQGLRLTALFFTAGALCLFRGRIPLSMGLLGSAIAALVLALVTGRGWHGLYPLALAYLVVWLALVPAGLIRLYNRLGDYSYGFYLWQFPIQQWIVLRNPDASPLELMLTAAPVTLVLAVLSWHFVEAPSLALKRRIAVAAAAA
jgi:peptidoglycan/LPS O-acetylase OafA/YrhL